MAIQIKANGSFSIEYEGPYAGLDVQHPETEISDKASPSFNNFMLRNAELRSRPSLTQLYPGPSDQGFVLGISSFIDINNTTHVVAWEGSTLYQYDPTLLPGNPWATVGTACLGDMGQNSVAYRTFANQIFYANTGFQYVRSGRSKITPFLAYWDGLSAAPVYQQTYSDASVSNSIAGISKTNSPTVGGSLPGNPTVVGPLDIGGAFLGELNNYLILANINVKDENTGIIRNYPNLMWWCANGLPLIWDPTVNTSAGFNPFLDVSDVITGLVTMGVAGYVFRTNGITQFSPTGSGILPWQFDHMWASDHGIGNVLPWSIAQYGPNAVFISTDNIYSLSITSSSPIGGTARDAIFADIAASAFTPFAAIVPYFKDEYVYLTYQLYVSINGFARVWLYSFEDQNWSPWDLGLLNDPNYPILACAPNVV